jgi:predicted Zn-ribbon and HTH transcriptional regulator
MQNLIKNTGANEEVVKNFFVCYPNHTEAQLKEKVARLFIDNHIDGHTWTALHVMIKIAFRADHKADKKQAKKSNAPFKCNECGKTFRSVNAAEKAAWDGCPNCNSTDIDIN